MNKSDITIVALLFVLLIGWGFYYRQKQPPPLPPPIAGATNAVAGATDTNRPAPPAAVAPTLAAPATPAPVPAPAAVEVEHAAAEATAALSNGVAVVTVSSWGGAIKSVELKGFRQAVDPASPPVVLDFAASPALALGGVTGWPARADFALAGGPAPDAVTLTATVAPGLHLERTIRLGRDYRVEVQDAFRNDGAGPLTLPSYSVGLGPMPGIHSRADQGGQMFIGLDTLADAGGATVQRWEGNTLAGWFGAGGGGCAGGARIGPATPAYANQRVDTPLTWLAARNKFFVQILAPEGGAAGGEVSAVRDRESSSLLVSTVSGALRFPEKVVAPGQTVARKMSYYAGPKKYDILKTLGQRQDEVMLYAWWEWFRKLCAALLWTLNKLYALIPNYGIAVIVLTCIVRFVFWPVTRKSTASMKKMADLQPKVAELRAKLKDKPQKMNQEIMALYKEHKVNPMAGCLPIVIQMPVFIALFNVLRSAVELRFAGFLWIADLSEPEGILAHSLPFGGLNILPLVMTATTIWQQKLTPSGGDPQQQKMMMLMPVFMLFLFYNMASALVLYWTVSQLLSIAGMLIQKRRGKLAAAVVKR